MQDIARQGMSPKIDPITRSVVQHRLSSIVKEMGEAMRQFGRKPTGEGQTEKTDAPEPNDDPPNESPQP